MPARFSPQGALVFSIATGALGFVSSIANLFTLANASAVLSFGSMAVGCVALAVGRFRSARRQDHRESLEHTGDEVSIVLRSKTFLLNHIEEQDKRIVVLSAKLIEAQANLLARGVALYSKDAQSCQDEKKTPES